MWVRSPLAPGQALHEQQQHRGNVQISPFTYLDLPVRKRAAALLFESPGGLQPETFVIQMDVEEKEREGRKGKGKGTEGQTEKAFSF